MKFNFIKNMTKIMTKSKDTIIKHGPQIMAVAGAGCFIAATVCAVKETPKAMAKLEEKKAKDSEMSTLQKAAVIAPEYKKTIALTLVGTGLTAGAWHLVNGRMTALSAMLASAVKEKETLIEASKEVVGEEKTKEVVTKAEEIRSTDDEIQAASAGIFDTDDIPYLFRFDNGTEQWMTWADFKRGNKNAIDTAAKDRGITEADYFRSFGVIDEEKITKYMNRVGWQPTAQAAVLCENSRDWYEWASEVGEYTAELFEYDHYRHLTGWNIHWRTEPKPWDNDRF